MGDHDGRLQFLHDVKALFGADLLHKGIGLLEVVADDPVEHRFADGVFDDPHLTSGRDAEGLHDGRPVDGGLPIAQVVLGLDLLELFLDDLEVAVVFADLLLVFGGDVGMAEQHQVVDVVARVEKEPPYSGVRHDVLGEDDGAEVEQHQLLHVFHLLVERKLELGKDFGHHLGAFELMAVEGPSGAFLPALGLGLGDVVQQGRPTEPQVVAFLGHLVEHLHGMEEVVLVALAVDHLHALEQAELGQDVLQQARFVEQQEARGGSRRHHDLVQFLRDPLHGDDLDAFRVAGDGVERVGVDIEMQLRGEADGPHHAQGVVGIGDVGVERGADGQVFEIAHPVEGVEKSPEVVLVEADGHGVDGEIAAVLVVFEGAVFHEGLAAVTVVRLATGAHKLNLNAFVTDHRRAEGAIVFRLLVARQVGSHLLGQGDAAPDGHDVDVVRFPPEQDIAHIAANHITPHAQLLTGLGDEVE